MKAQIVLAVILLTGLGTVMSAPQPDGEIAKLVQAAASGDAVALKTLEAEGNSGNRVAQNELGNMYGSGAGVPRDLLRAAEWFTKAANAGHPDAQYNLGQMYRSGIGVPQDMKRAASWYGKAAAQNHTSSLYNLAGMYINGDGVPENLEEGRRLLRKAAALGHVEVV